MSSGSMQQHAAQNSSPRAPQRSRIVPRVHDKQQAADARDTALERAHPPQRRLARPCARVLRRHKHVEPHLGARSVVAALEEQQHSIKRVGKRVAPRVADEPRRFAHML